jgi:hypothetical protein
MENKEVIQEVATHTPPTDPHTFKITGKVTIKCGDEVIVETQPNHMVNQGLKGLISFLSCSSYFGSGNNSIGCYGPNYGYTMRLGLDTTTTTVATTTELSNKLSVILPAVAIGSDAALKSTDYWVTRRTAIFSPGAYVGTIGEIGLYMNMPTTTTNKWSATNGMHSASILVARMSVGDGDFVSFDYPQDLTLTIEWELGVSA